MKKLLILVSTPLLISLTLFAQQPKSVPRPVPAPKGPPPYVLKKDYEPQIAEMNTKISAANNAAAAVRRSMEGKFDKMVELDSQMQQVQAILSSANFQIAMNADTLKETRTTLEGIQKNMDENFSKMAQAHADLSNYLWILFGVSMACTVAVLVVLMNMMKKRMSSLETILHQNEEVLKKSLSLGLEKQQKELKTEMHSLESRMMVDTATIKRELTHQLNQQKDNTHAMIESLAAKLASMEAPPESKNDADATGETDPELII